MTIFAAGILFRKGKNIFLVRRADDQTWTVPGGKIESGETPQQAARREVQEECGFTYPLPMTPYTINQCAEGEFITYLADSVDTFPVILNDENTESGWFPLDALPEPLHPGLVDTLRNPALTETDVAGMISTGVLPSPQFFMNMFLWAIRVTGTGITWRSSDEEFTFRDPDDYLNDKFLARIPGTPVIWLHPEKRTLDHDEFEKRIIGTLTNGYIKNSDVWSIARIYDLDAAENMMTIQLSTSPTVCLDTGKSDKIIFDGEPLLLEDSPVLLDHVAICEMGVWDKQIAPTGIQTDSLKPEVNEMADIDKNELAKMVADLIDSRLAERDAKADAEAEERKKADAEAEEMKKKADAEENERKAKEEEEKKKSDSETEEEKEERLRKEEEAKKKADAEEEERKKADSEISALRAQMAELKSRIPTELSDSDREAVAAAQMKADSVFASFGERAPVALSGENARGYRTRVLNKLKQHSDTFKSTDVSAIADAATLDLVEKTIFADAERASRSGNAQITGLREVKRRDGAGREISEFVGDVATCWAPFTSPSRRLVNIRS